MLFTEDYAPQYQRPCVLVDGAAFDFALRVPETADAVIDFARKVGAVFHESDHDVVAGAAEPCLVVQFPGRPQELYTEAAIRRTFSKRSFGGGKK